VPEHPHRQESQSSSSGQAQEANLDGIRAAAPRVVLEGIEASSSSAEAIEEAVALECRAFGRVLDAEFHEGRVIVYFDSETAALSCGWRLKSVLGRPLSDRPLASSPTRPWVEVEVSFEDEEIEDGEEVATAVGKECAAYGRVLDAMFLEKERVVRVAFATSTGAGASVVGVDGTAFDGRLPVVAHIAGSKSRPKAILRGYFSERSPEEVVAEFSRECSRFGTVTNCSVVEEKVEVDFLTSRQAAACAAAMDGRVFDGSKISGTFRVRGGGGDFDAAFANALWDALKEREGKADDSQAKTSKLEKAIRTLRAGARANPKDEKMKANLAGALLRLGGYEEVLEALDFAQAAVELAPKWSWAHFRKGSALLALGEIAKAATSLKLASGLEPENAHFKKAADEASRAAEQVLDPLDAYVATTVQAEAAKDLVDAADAEKKNRADIKNGVALKKKRKREGLQNFDDSDDDEEATLDYNPRAHCYVCKQWGHSKRDCPLARCQYCHDVGHKKGDCPLFTAALQNAVDDEKQAKRKAQYEKKKAKRKEEWTEHLRQQTGIEGFAALYRVLGLPERRLASAADIKRAYHRRSLEYHPDKHPTNREEAHKRFLEIKAAYELLVEGMENGGRGMQGAVFSAGELTDAAAAKALQEKVNHLAEKVSKNKEWQG